MAIGLWPLAFGLQPQRRHCIADTAGQGPEAKGPQGLHTIIIQATEEARQWQEKRD